MTAAVTGQPLKILLLQNRVIVGSCSSRIPSRWFTPIGSWCVPFGEKPVQRRPLAFVGFSFEGQTQELSVGLGLEMLKGTNSTVER